MTFPLQDFHLLVRDFQPFLVAFGHQGRPYFEASFRCRATNVAEHEFQGSQWFACPVVADVTEQAMFHWVPLGGSPWVMTHGDCQSGSVGELLQLPFPQAWPTAVTSARVCQNQQVRRLTAHPGPTPPCADRVNGKLWCICGQTDIHEPSILPWHIQSVRRCSPRALREKVMAIDLFRFQTPRLAVILEVADHLLFLGIHADYGPTGLLKPFPLAQCGETVGRDLDETDRCSVCDWP